MTNRGHGRPDRRTASGRGGRSRRDRERSRKENTRRFLDARDRGALTFAQLVHSRVSVGHRMDVPRREHDAREEDDEEAGREEDDDEEEGREEVEEVTRFLRL